jgi:hypothetical protein
MGKCAVMSNMQFIEREREISVFFIERERERENKSELGVFH